MIIPNCLLPGRVPGEAKQVLDGAAVRGRCWAAVNPAWEPLPRLPRARRSAGREGQGACTSPAKALPGGPSGHSVVDSEMPGAVPGPRPSRPGRSCIPKCGREDKARPRAPSQHQPETTREAAYRRHRVGRGAG